MIAHITFRNMDHSDPMEQHARKQLAKIEKLLSAEGTPQSFDVVLQAHKVHAHHEVEIRIKTPHYNVIAHKQGTDMYELIDHTVDVAYRELLNAKQRFVDDRRKGLL